MTYPVRFASWRWMTGAAAALIAVIALAVGLRATAAPHLWTPAGPSSGPAQSLTSIAAHSPNQRLEVIVQLRRGADPAAARALVTGEGGRVTRDLHLINGFGAVLRASDAARLSRNPHVVAVTPNYAVKASDDSLDTPDPNNPNRLSTNSLGTAFAQSIRADKVWKTGPSPVTGSGVGVAVLDTGLDGSNPDFNAADGTSRVAASVVTNPDASDVGDYYGHGTHVAGLIAGNGNNRPAGDPLRGKYVGVAPNANLVPIKVSDDHGDTRLIDVIYGLQFAVDHKADYNIRVANLSLNSSVAQSYKTDPLDAAVEATWFSGIVVVVPSGNRGTAADAVNYAPANDPYVITVGGVDDQGDKVIRDDKLAPWSSYGTTQDGISKPELLAPGAHIVSNLAAGSDFASLCPSCIVDGSYFKVGGTSMASAITAGGVADVVQAHPTWTPDQVKGAIVNNLRDVPGAGGELALDSANKASSSQLVSNQNLTPSTLLAPDSRQLDPSRISWSRISWSRISWSRISWSRISWSCACTSAADGTETATSADTSRISWSRISWSRISWSTSFDK